MNLYDCLACLYIWQTIVPPSTIIFEPIDQFQSNSAQRSRSQRLNFSRFYEKRQTDKAKMNI